MSPGSSPNPNGSGMKCRTFASSMMRCGKRSSASRTILADATTRSRKSTEEHTSELQSLMRISYAVFCLKKKNRKKVNKYHKNLHNNDDNTNYTQLIHIELN